MATMAQERELAEANRAELAQSHPSMDTRLRHALAERGHGSAAVEAMTPRERFEEFCDWEGLVGWGGTLLAVARSAGVRL